ncbi:MAG: sodium:solute symporter family protein [Planctomycetota bacterium]|jgi:Na+/proline symporter
MGAALWVILGFLAALTGLGAWYARRIKTAEDFALAGRQLGVPVLIGTLVATWTGTGSLFAAAEFTYTHGIAGFVYTLASPLGIVALAFLAPMARRLPAQTVPQILGVRFGVVAQRLGALTLVVAYLIIVSYQYRAGAGIGQRIFPGLDATTLTIGFAVFVILFTALAGMFSVALTDVVCGVVMVVGLLIALALILKDWSAAEVTLPEDLRHFSGGQGWIFWVGVMLPGFLLILGDANMHQRFLAAKSPAAARYAAVGMFFGVLIVDWAIVGVALLGGLLLPDAPENPGHVVVEVAFRLMPGGVGLIITAAAVAIILSTADSYLLATATSAAGDIVRGFRRPAWQRTLVVVLGVTALGLAFTTDEFFSVAIYAYTLYGASLTPAVLLALLRPKTAPAVVIAGMASGLGTALLWKGLLWGDVIGAPWSELEPVIPALAANVAAMLIAGVVVRSIAHSD